MLGIQTKFTVTPTFPEVTLLFPRICSRTTRTHQVVTIEPGYYLPDRYGIRLENDVIVVRHTDAGSGNEQSPPKWLRFDPVTLVPFQRRLINPALLTADELGWLNQYHRLVRSTLHDSLRAEAATLTKSRQRCWDWIERETEELVM